MTHSLVLADGRTLEFRFTGAEGALPLVFHHGTPGTLPTRGFTRTIHDRGLGLVSISRPGYGGSTSARGRAVVDVVADTGAVLRELGVTRCLVAGWSGGGPHALACAAQLPEAVGVLVIAGIGPSTEDGLDFLAGMNAENTEEWGAVFRGEQALRDYVGPVAPSLMGAQSGGTAADTDDLPAADVAAMDGEFGEDLVAANRDGLGRGIDGWVDDELAFSKPWGFALSEIAIPATFWHGSDDANVPFAHGHWVSAHVPNATLHREDGEGHMSIIARSAGRMLDDLLAAI